MDVCGTLEETRDGEPQVVDPAPTPGFFTLASDGHNNDTQGDFDTR